MHTTVPREQSRTLAAILAILGSVLLYAILAIGALLALAAAALVFGPGLMQLL